MAHSGIQTDTGPAVEAAALRFPTSDLSRFGIAGLGWFEPAGLTLRTSAPGEFRIGLCGIDGSVAVEFGPYGDDEIVGEWKRLSAASGLPFAVAAADEAAACGTASARPARTCERRKRLVVLTGRRPRFLTRRRTARLPQRPLVYREAVLAGGRD